MTKASSRGTTAAFLSVTTLFFAWGAITSLIDPLVAAVKGVFSLTDLEAQLSASAFFIAYGICSLPAAGFVGRRGPVLSILTALVLMFGGCLIMLWAANLAVYGLVLLGLFVLASGITMLQVAANPLAAALGDPARSHLRLTLSQAFNSLGTFLGPIAGAHLFLKGLEVKAGAAVSAQARSDALAGIDFAYVSISALIALLATFFFVRRRAIAAAVPSGHAGQPQPIAMLLRQALASRWAVLGAGAIFLYVGAEVAIGSQMAFFLNSDAIWGHSDAAFAVPLLGSVMGHDGVAGVSLQEAGKAVGFYWGGAMVGRLLGSVLLTRVRAASLLSLATAVAGAMCLYVAFIGGVGAGFVALSIGLFNSIMFPLIFTLTLEKAQSVDGAHDEAVSGLLCTAIIGGAAVPPLVGLVSGHHGYAFALVIPALCYGALFVFAQAAGRGSTGKAANRVGGH